MIIWWSKHVGVILNVLVCDIWINVLIQTSALVDPLYTTKNILVLLLAIKKDLHRIYKLVVDLWLKNWKSVKFFS
jgi:hypothetical protein